VLVAGARSLAADLLPRIFSGGGGGGQSSSSGGTIEQAVQRVLRDQIRRLLRQGITPITRAIQGLLQGYIGGAADAVGATSCGSYAALCACVSGIAGSFLMDGLSTWLADQIVQTVDLSSWIGPATAGVIGVLQAEGRFAEHFGALVTSLGAGRARVEPAIRALPSYIQSALPHLDGVADRFFDVLAQRGRACSTHVASREYIRALDCVISAMREALREGGGALAADAVNTAMNRLFGGDAGGLRQRIASHRRALLSTLQDAGIAIPGSVAQILEEGVAEGAEEVLRSFAGSIPGCMGQLVAAGSIRERAVRALECLARAARTALTAGGTGVARGLIRGVVNAVPNGLPALQAATG
jgi:hypothetical protein